MSNVFLTTDENGDKRITIIKPVTDPNIIQLLDPSLMNFKLQNDRFSYYDTNVQYKLEVNLIDKATPKDIAKYFPTAKFQLVLESYEQYQELTREDAKNSNKTWLYNILDGISEQDRILLDDPEFLLMLHPTWSGSLEDINHLQCLAIVKDRNILSLREVTSDHFNLLTSILENSLKTISDRFGVAKSRVRAFVHYHPTFWHLHVHFKLIENISSYEFDRSHSVISIIQNIQMMSDYYQRVNLQISIPEDKIVLYNKI